MLSESTCLALLLISAALAVIAFQQKKFRYALASVLFLSLASYVRSMFDLVGTVILLSLCLPYVITWIWRYFFTGNKNAKTISRTEAVGFAKLLALLALFSLLNSPWKLQNKNMTGHFEMSADPYLLADKILWAPDDRHLNSWELGGNTACLVDPDLCRLVGEAGQKLSNETKLNLALFLFFRHPVKWIQLKLPYLSALWFDAATGIFSDNQGSSLIDGFFFLALLFAVPWAIHFCFKQYASNGRAAVINFALIFFVVVALHVTIFALKNPRYRYSVPLKVFLLFSPAVLFSVTNNSEEISPTTSP